MVDTGTVMALMRGLHLAAMLSLLGAAGFVAWILPAAGPSPEGLCRRLIRVCWASGVVALLAGLAWFTLQAAAIADAGNATEIWAALAPVAQHTRYGGTLMVRLALLLFATLAAMTAQPPAVIVRYDPDVQPRERGRLIPQATAVTLTIILVAIALALQGVIGHAGATGGAIGNSLVLSEALHLLAAGLWLGALLPLWMSLRVLPPAAAAAVCHRFSPIGLACVLVLAGTGFAQGLELIGSLPALFGTHYGHIALVKIALFLLALLLAAVNRLWLSDRLAVGGTDARRHLLGSVAVESAIGLAIITAAALLASSVPSMHETPVWPFSWQFSLVTLREDADFRQEVVFSLLAIGGAIIAITAAFLFRRFRLPALILLLAIIFWRGPSLSLLTTEAYPTSFQTSPTGFSAAAITHGQVLFARNCVACHGPEGEGNGPAAAALRIKPADLTQPHIQEHTDGEMFWFLTHGIDDLEGGLAMPGFAAALSPDDRWALIDYVRAHNAAVAIEQDAAFDKPAHAPTLPITCNGIPATSTADLRGHAVLVVLGDTAASVPTQDAITLFVPADDLKPEPGTCVAADPAAWNAYAVLADLPPDEAAATAFLIDPNGWLRAVQRPGTTGGWHSHNDLLAAIRDICAHPIEQNTGVSHEHHH
jgi:putative copper export protein/mono/diheme cytochrome c family protein